MPGKNGWIRVCDVDNPPVKYANVLASVLLPGRAARETIRAWWGPNDRAWYDSTSFDPIQGVTHWQPLPPDPED
jgi:hypothetical protein